MEKHTTSVQVGEHTITFETGKIARQANGAVLVKVGETILFTSACATKEPGPDAKFFPLKVDYQEKFSSAGKTLGGFIKREGRPTERETLVCRLIDRPLRPLFPEGYFNEVQVLSYVFSFDGVHPAEPLAICAASAALMISDIPLAKPVGAVRVGLVDGKFVINPTVEQMKKSALDLMLAGSEDAILMIEGFCQFLTEEQVLEAIECGHKAIKDICHALVKWREKVGKQKHIGTLKKPSDALKNQIHSIIGPKLTQAVKIKEKAKRDEAVNLLKNEVILAINPEGKDPVEDPFIVLAAFEEIYARVMRQMVLKENVRADGRTTKDIRVIDVEQAILPRAHGSSLFTRGETQALCVCTLGGESMAQRYEDLNGEGNQRFYLQYFFPPFSVGEVGRVGAPGRREVGHGKLAERALAATLPPRDVFPYTVRLESNITESNGSSSMASVCGGCLALMDAGVPIKRPVAGIAMGLILEGSEFAILSDILGLEDFLGDMDFKVAGDESGITAFQMDIKIEGITIEIMKKALAQAKEGRVHILKKMLETCPKPKEQMSQHAPRIANVQVKPSKIGTIIGPGGKQIRAIMEETGVQIDIDDSGLISISSPNLTGIDKALAIIHGLTAEIEIGQTYTGSVTSVVPFGVFVMILPGKEGLCHISEFDHQRIEKLDGLVKVGDTIDVKVLDINERGQLKLSRKVLLPR